MINRCRHKSVAGSERYLGAGISVAPRWERFENFLADMGERPEGTTLDRKENTLGYGPDNCRWASPAEQVANRSNTVWIAVEDEHLPLNLACRRFGVNNSNVHWRARKRGLSHQQAFDHYLNGKR
jgi:hypothetical protein